MSVCTIRRKQIMAETMNSGFHPPFHNIVILLQPRVIHPAGFPAPVRLVDVHAQIDGSDRFLGMTLDLTHDVLAGQGGPVDLSAQRSDDVA